MVNDEQKPASPPKASTVMATSDSALAADLIREFLEHFELHSSLSVMVPEANLDSEYPGRAPLAVRLGLDDSSGDAPQYLPGQEPCTTFTNALQPLAFNPRPWRVSCDR